MRWTEEQFAEYLSRNGVPGSVSSVDTSAPPFALPVGSPAGGRLALGRLRTGEMNKTEARYAEHLEHIKGSVIAWYKFEAVKLRLADNTFYTPDFAVMLIDGPIEMHEVKGFWEDDARVKIKVAAETFPFRFKAFKAEAKKRGGGWIGEAF